MRAIHVEFPREATVEELETFLGKLPKDARLTGLYPLHNKLATVLRFEHEKYPLLHEGDNLERKTIHFREYLKETPSEWAKTIARCETAKAEGGLTEVSAFGKRYWVCLQCGSAYAAEIAGHKCSSQNFKIPDGGF